MQITLTEGIILALITFAGTLATGWWGFRGMLRKADQEATATDATARAELERLLMARVDQLQKHIQANEDDLAEVRQEVATLREENAGLRAENAALRARVRDLEAELARICKERGGDGIRGITGS